MYPQLTFSTLEQLRTYVNENIIPNNLREITGEKHNNAANGFVDFINKSVINWEKVQIISDGGVLSITKPFVLIQNTVPDSLTWSSNMYNEFYITNATDEVIPLVGVGYFDFNLDFLDYIPAHSNIHVAQAGNNAWVQMGGASAGFNPVEIQSPIIYEDGILSLLSNEAGGVVILDENGKIPTGFLPDGLLDGAGTAGKLAKFSDANTLTDSLVSETATTVNINANLTIGNATYVGYNIHAMKTGSPMYMLLQSSVRGGLAIGPGTSESTAALILRYTTGNAWDMLNDMQIKNLNNRIVLTTQYFPASNYLKEGIALAADSSVSMWSLSGTGNRNLYVDANGKLIAGATGSGPVGGGGSAGYLPLWNGDGTTLTNSQVYQDANYLYVSGLGLNILGGGPLGVPQLTLGTASDQNIIYTAGGTIIFRGNGGVFNFQSWGGGDMGTIGGSGVRFQALGGTGTEMVTVTADGWLGRAPIPGGGGGGGGDVYTTAVNTFSSAGSLILPDSGAAPNLRVGSLEFQSLGANYGIIGQGIYYATDHWERRSSYAGSFIYQSEGATSFYTSTAGTAGTPVVPTIQLHLESNGTVGIGTLTPQVPLEVVGPIRSSSVASTGDGPFMQIGYNPGLDVNLIVGSYYGASSYKETAFYVGGSERVRIDVDGNVGIGTDTPGVALDVRRSGSVGINFQGGNGSFLEAYITLGTGAESWQIDKLSPLMAAYGLNAGTAVYYVQGRDQVFSNDYGTLVPGQYRQDLVIKADGEVHAPSNQLRPTASFGQILVQSYSVNNNWFGDNMFYDGLSWRVRETGYGSIQYNNSAGWGIYQTGTTAVAGAAVVPQYNFMVMFDRTVKMPGYAGVGTRAIGVNADGVIVIL